MKKNILIALTAALMMAGHSFAQKSKKKVEVPGAVSSALAAKFPESASAKITWEMEKVNYEANWGGKSGEAHSAQFTPTGDFVEIVNTIPVSELPMSVIAYVHQHYKGLKITEAAKLTKANGTTFYEAEVKGKEIFFDESGKFQKNK